MLLVLRLSVRIESPRKNNLGKKITLKIVFMFSSTELNSELFTTEYTIQKQNAIELSEKVAQSTSIFVDKYRFNSILKKNFGAFHMQGAFSGLYVHYCRLDAANFKWSSWNSSL